MPKIKCPKCVNLFAICEHKRVDSNFYAFVLKCDVCGSFIGEKVEKDDKLGGCPCPFCGGIEKPNETKK